MFGYKSLEDANKNTVIEVEFYGGTYNLELVAINHDSDLCMVSFNSKYAKKISRIKISSEKPKTGDIIYTSSAPQGISNHNIRLHFEGRYSGCANEKECFYTIPGVIGSSGSGVLNDKGELVGILNFSVIGFHNVTGGPPLYQIREFVLTNLGKL